jgi:hypothetical protein
MRSLLVLRAPSNGTGWQGQHAFNGADEHALRDCLDQLVAFTTPAPVERWDSRKHGRVIEAECRWTAAMLLYADEPYVLDRTVEPVSAEAAWTADGARRLAELLPERLDSLRTDIRARFGP